MQYIVTVKDNTHLYTGVFDENITIKELLTFKGNGIITEIMREHSNGERSILY